MIENGMSLPEQTTTVLRADEAVFAVCFVVEIVAVFVSIHCSLALSSDCPACAQVKFASLSGWQWSGL